MNNTRRVLFAQNAQLQAQLVACGPDATLSRRQLRERLSTARKEVDALTAHVSSLTSENQSLIDKLAAIQRERQAEKAAA